METFTSEITVTVWQLTEPADMFTALSDLHAQGWRGGVHVSAGADGSVWGMELSTNSAAQSASLGQVLVLINGRLDVLGADEYSAQFGS